jgi:glycosyltransferase involved in cell wall biosynthesis
VIEGETGKLVPVGEEKALALALEELLTTPELRERLGQQARREALTRYDAAKNYPRILARLKGLTQK